MDVDVLQVVDDLGFKVLVMIEVRFVSCRLIHGPLKSYSIFTIYLALFCFGICTLDWANPEWRRVNKFNKGRKSLCFRAGLIGKSPRKYARFRGVLRN